jgi:hypothetical protein
VFVRWLILAVCAVHVPSAAWAIDGFRLLRMDGFELKWGSPQLGSAAAVTYALVDKPVHFSDTINCGAMNPLEPMLERSRVSSEEFVYELEMAMAAWSEVAGVTFAEAPAATADILIGTQQIPRGRAFTNVEFDREKGVNGVATLSRSLICFNPEQPWKIGFDGQLDAYDIRYVLMHELGHAIGLNHPYGRESLMHHSYQESFRELQKGDIAGSVMIYGAPATPGPVAIGEAPLVASEPAAMTPVN